MSLTQYRAALIDFGQIAVTRALTELGLIKTTLTKAEAYRKCGRAQIDRWLKEGLLNPVRDAPGNVRWRIDRTELEVVIRASNRHTFLNTEERRIK